MLRIKWAVLFSGCAAVTTQTVLIREGLSLFGGYELISGILLCFWLLWGGFGSYLFSKLRIRLDPIVTYAVLLLLLCLAVLFSITLMRYALHVFSLPFGEVIPLTKTVLIGLIVLCPTCMIFGALFPAASRIFEPERVYLLEGLGAFVGGIIISFILIDILPAYGIVLVTICILTLCAFVVMKRYGLICISLLLLVPLMKIHDIEFFFRKAQLPGQHLIGVRESRYNLIAVTRSGDQANMYVNGIYDFTYPDIFTSEEAVHYAMLMHESAKHVLLIGGGMSNCLTQIAKHPSVEKITYCELDPLLFIMNKEYVGADIASDKLMIVMGDARLYIKSTPERYDVIIINIPDPVNGQLNRFYTAEFFDEARRILRQGGLLSIRVTAPPDIVSPLFAQLLSTVHATLQTSFSNVVVLPTAKTTFLATDYAISIDSIVPLLKQRLETRGLELVYVNDYFFDYNLTSEKIQYLQDRIRESPGIVNTDLKPVCYYFTTILWGGVVSEPLRNVFVWLFKLHPLVFLIPLLPVFFFYKRRSLIYVSVFAIGASEISAEVILIILFQMLFGYLYGWIGAIIACYMLGLTCGTLFYLKSSWLRGNLIRLLSYLEITMAFYFGIIIVLSVMKVPGAHVIVPALIFCGGFLGGLHFPLSVKLLTREKAAYVYSVDLIGSSIGALLTSVILIPIVGIVYTLFLFVVLNAIVGIGLLTVR